jgi:hypothetical protein
MRGIECRSERVLIGSDARAADVLQRLMPARYRSRLCPQFERFRRDPR